jgi:hypothetical protein
MPVTINKSGMRKRFKKVETQPGCRWFRNGECRVHRHGRRPSPGVCRICELHGQNRILGIGDLLRLVITPVVDRLPVLRRVTKKCGCQQRQEKLNRFVPLGFRHD